MITIAILIFCITGCQKNDIVNNTDSTEIIKNKSTDNSSDTNSDFIQLKVYPQVTYDEIPAGWLDDILKEKLNISLSFINPAGEENVKYYEDYNYFEDDFDIYIFSGEHSIWDCIKNNKLVRLDSDDYLEKYHDTFDLYKKSLKKNKKLTMERTGIEGIYGLPYGIDSCDERGKEYFYISIPESSQNKDKAMELLNYLYSIEGIMTLNYGPEEQGWKYIDGKYKVTDLGKKINKNPYDKIIESSKGKQSLDDGGTISLFSLDKNIIKSFETGGVLNEK